MPSEAKQVEFHPMVHERVCFPTTHIGTIYKIPKPNLGRPNLYASTLYVGSTLTDTASVSPILIKVRDAFEKSFEKNYISPQLETRTIGIEILSSLSEINILENFISPLPDGGIAIDFNRNNVKYLVEIYNDNEDVLSKIEPNQPIKAWDLNHNELLDMLNDELK